MSLISVVPDFKQINSTFQKFELLIMKDYIDWFVKDCNKMSNNDEFLFLQDEGMRRKQYILSDPESKFTKNNQDFSIIENKSTQNIVIFATVK